MASQHFEIIPTWDGQSSTLDAYEQRVKVYAMSTEKPKKYLCGPRLLARFDPDSHPFRIITEKLSGEKLTAEDGSGGKAIASALRTQLGPTSMQEAARLFLRLLKLNDIRRLSGESMKKWTTRFNLSLRKVGAALHAACTEIPIEGFLHPMIQGIPLRDQRPDSERVRFGPRHLRKDGSRRREDRQLLARQRPDHGIMRSMVGRRHRGPRSFPTSRADPLRHRDVHPVRVGAHRRSL